MVRRIISGGQTGADRAALDTAIRLGVDHGGWVPRGRRAEDGPVPMKYSLQETTTANYPERTEMNVRDADATLIVSRGRLTGGSLLTQGMARKHGKPCLHVDLADGDVDSASEKVRIWLVGNGVEVLNVAGPRAGSDTEVYRLTSLLLERTLEKPPSRAGL